jgi:pimeloyl-ACP methyl ester carboxylesterase
MRKALLLVILVLDVPLLGRLARRLTPEPAVEELHVDGVLVQTLRPPGGEPRPAWIFVNGAHPLRRREPVVWRLATGLARAGYVVFVPDIPGLGDGTVTARTLAATGAVTAAACRREDVREGRVGLVGASTGAGLALIAAGRPDLADRISVVAAVAPFADLRKLICLTTTGHYEEEGRFAPYEVTDLHRQVVARSLVAAIPAQDDRERLLARLDDIEREGLNPLEELPRRADGMNRDARAVVELLENRDPERFEELFVALPSAVHEFMEELSPLRFREGLQAPIEIAVPPSDVYFPPGEAAALAALPNARLTVTRTLDHTRPSISLTHLRSFARFMGFVVRGLRAAG